MLAFVDESGDLGLKLDAGSSERFTLVAVLLEDETKTQRVKDEIARVRRELRLDYRYEFSFNGCRHDVRLKFLRAVAPCDFSYYAVVVDKARLAAPEFKDQVSFYQSAAGLLFSGIREVLDRATVIVDRRGGKHFGRDLQTYLKRRINTPERRVIEKLVMHDSARDSLVQLADMAAGAVSRSFSSKERAMDYREILSRRERRVELWPK